MINAYAADAAKGTLKPFSYNPGPLGPEEVEIRVESCGICHSDLSMLDNDWGITQYPFVPGHEAIGRITAMGPQAKGLKIGQRVGVGWFADSCHHCDRCVGGDQNLCAGGKGTIVARHGGFADTLRAHWMWAIPVPDALSPLHAGPLLCGGITVFGPMLEMGVKPTDRVGVIGIGGLGHMAIKFLRAWGCDVTAFSSSPDKKPEALSMGAHHFVASRKPEDLAPLAGRFEFIISTVNVTLDWASYINALAPKGRLHVVGAVLEPMAVGAFPLIMGQKSVSGSPTGSVSALRTMLDFAGRHNVEPTCEVFPMSKVNDALDRLRSGKARYRVVLSNMG